MRRGLTIAAAVISSVALIGLGAGCGDGDNASVTPEDATTIANNAPQTDSEGKTVFEANCQGCHPAGGTEAGVGPQLSATALDAAGITNVVSNGRGAMPGGLVSGADLDNVVAYVESLKG